MKKHSYQYIFDYFQSYDYQLLSTNYINGSQKLKYVCDKGHENEMSFYNFKKGKRCPVCSKQKSVKNMTDTKRKQAEKKYYKNPRHCVYCDDIILYKPVKDSYRKYCDNEECIKASKTMNENIFIRKYGEIDGNKRFKKYRQKQSKSRTLDGYIERFGEVEGIKKYKLVQESMIGHGYSKISQELFWGIYNNLPKQLKEKCYFAELNREFGKWNKDHRKGYTFDFTNIHVNIVIEFNGDDVHANPLFYNKDDMIKYIVPKRAGDIWEYDKCKKEFIESIGFDCIYVWENEFRKSSVNVVKEMVDKIMEKYNAV